MLQTFDQLEKGIEYNLPQPLAGRLIKLGCARQAGQNAPQTKPIQPPEIKADAADKRSAKRRRQSAA
jgi:hypothetical protein